MRITDGEKTRMKRRQDFMTFEEAIAHIRKSLNCSREEAIRALAEKVATREIPAFDKRGRQLTGKS